MDEWMRNMYITQWKTIQPYSTFKHKRIMPFVTTWVGLEGMMLSEISQTWKDKYCVISHVWNLKTSHLKKQRVEWWLLGAGG